MGILLLLSLRTVTGGLSLPVQVVSAHDGSGRLFVAEQAGRVRVIDGGVLLQEPFLDISPLVGCCDNGGLLSIAFDPGYAVNGRCYLFYVDRNGDTVLARYLRSAEGDSLDPASGVILMVVDQPANDVPNHHGGTLQFGPDGFLYVSVGDGGAAEGVSDRAQDPASLLGKLLRIDTNGLAIPEIWSSGLRNPWRFSFDRETGALLLADVGHDAWEEINILSLAAARGANFGWPMMEGAHCFPPDAACNPGGLVLPQIEYSRDLGCSVTGGYRYRGARVPSLKGAYVYGDWCSGRIRAAREEQGTWVSSPIANTDLAIVSFGEDDDGELYVVDYNGTVFAIAENLLKRRSVRR